MAAGIQYSKPQLDMIAGNLAVTFKRLMEQAGDFNAWLTAQPDSALIALGYAAADLTVLRAAAADMVSLTLVSLTLVATGQQNTVATATDYTANAKQLWGVGF